MSHPSPWFMSGMLALFYFWLGTKWGKRMSRK